MVPGSRDQLGLDMNCLGKKPGSLTNNRQNYQLCSRNIQAHWEYRDIQSSILPSTD